MQFEACRLSTYIQLVPVLQLENARRLQTEAAADRQAAEMVRRQMAAAQGAADGATLKQLMGLATGSKSPAKQVGLLASLRSLVATTLNTSDPCAKHSFGAYVGCCKHKNYALSRNLTAFSSCSTLA